jgi:drug/metabolite transporter (DMT)-like permease
LVGIWSYFDWKNPEGLEWIWLIGTGLATQFAQLAMTKAFMQEKAAKVSSLQYLGLLYALILGWLIFGEGFEPATIMGMVLVSLGVILNVIFSSLRKTSIK